MPGRLGKLPTTPIRYAHRAPDGTIAYFEASDGRQVGGRLPAGADPKQLEERGYTFVDRDTYTQAKARTDPEYRAEQADVDDLAEAFDMNMVSTGGPDILQGLLDKKVNEQQMQPVQIGGATLSPEEMEVLEEMMEDGSLADLFQPFQQEQAVLDQQMALAQGLRQRGPQRSTPMGALLGGLSNAIGNVGGTILQKKALEGQRQLGQRMQGDATGRLTALLEAMRSRQGTDPRTGLMRPAVEDDELAAIFEG